MDEKIYITADEIDSVTCERECQETAINWLRDDDIIRVCSSDNTFITKMKRVMQKSPNEYKCYYYKSNIDKKTGKVANYFFEFDKSLISFRAKHSKQTLTEEQRKERGARLHKNKKTIEEDIEE